MTSLGSFVCLLPPVLVLSMWPVAAFPAALDCRRALLGVEGVDQSILGYGYGVVDELANLLCFVGDEKCQCMRDLVSEDLFGGRRDVFRAVWKEELRAAGSCSNAAGAAQNAAARLCDPCKRWDDQFVSGDFQGQEGEQLVWPGFNPFDASQRSRFILIEACGSNDRGTGIYPDGLELAGLPNHLTFTDRAITIDESGPGDRPGRQCHAIDEKWAPVRIICKAGKPDEKFRCFETLPERRNIYELRGVLERDICG